MRVLLIDNYDSFTYNIVYYLKELGAKVKVVKNDFAKAKKAIKYANKFDKIIISPGFGTPDDSGVCMDIIKALGAKKQILGICLGHQCLAKAFGAEVVRMPRPFHGVSVECEFSKSTLFKGVKKPLKIALYNSLRVVNTAEFDILADIKVENKSIIMAIKHKKYSCYGVQFHPESILQAQGKKILKNFLNLK
ncbi:MULTISPECIES: anthranilate synthase component II [Campylobacter]|uniref:Aminodeoxychorismate synthase, glutaminase, component II n=1 Tax=Campylobacter lanienae NCTC 13004 TaxID=1031753 RepID=A0A1X9SQ29_9BACT|nr:MULTISPECIES: aminodeoxychorismate/anthranilate synthase component II [Campylobacter]ARQ98318.1 aminodeoxychorismate synthase, glutaminase, component II [Campylobacter lanienae NCTC 13004]MDY6135469.1 aminodeoxychorismate/anthranilate synthase component II [Campylobacter lanienae]